MLVAVFATLAVFGVAFKTLWDARVRESASQTLELYTPKPAEEPTTALFIGDSIISGGGASDSSQRFSSLVASKYGWVELNEARNGIGYLAKSNGCGKETCPNLSELVDSLQGYQPDVILVSAGRSDPYQAENNLSASVKDFYRQLSQSFPESKIITVLPFLNLEEQTPEFQNFKSNVRYWSGVYGAEPVDLGQPLAAKPELMTADGYQPNDKGYLEIAQAFFDAYGDK